MSAELAGARLIVRGLLLVAICMLVAAYLTWRDPPLPPYSGRVAGFAELAYAALGGAGLALLWILGALFVLAIARSVWRHALKRPHDRLF